MSAIQEVTIRKKPNGIKVTIYTPVKLLRKIYENSRTKLNFQEWKFVAYQFGYEFEEIDTENSQSTEIPDSDFHDAKLITTDYSNCSI